jgi:Holliday junction resolvase-like predicted endonuclease
MAAAGFLFILRGKRSVGGATVPMFSRILFQAGHWAPRKGLRDEENFTSEDGKHCAQWSLRRHGQIFVAWNYMPKRAKGEIDLIWLRQEDTGVCRFDVLAIDNHPGRPTVVRLPKDALSPSCRFL